jgi:hypothetical protein
MSYYAELEYDDGSAVKITTHYFATKQEAEWYGADVYSDNQNASGYYASEGAHAVTSIYLDGTGAVLLEQAMLTWVDSQVAKLEAEQDVLAGCSLYGQAHEVQSKLSCLREVASKAKQIEILERT